MFEHLGFTPSEIDRLPYYRFVEYKEALSRSLKKKNEQRKKQQLEQQNQKSNSKPSLKKWFGKFRK